MIQPEVLTKRFNKSVTFKQKMLVKLLALSQLWNFYVKPKVNPYISGELPYDTELIFILFERMYTKNLPSYIYLATSYMLDYYCPFWKDCIDDNILGIIVKRDSKLYKKWVSSVVNRDSYTCQDCGSKENLHVHHISHWAENPYLRIDIDNGVTLCHNCHSEQHPNMSKKLFVKKSA